ncbi:E3 ubiquitin-protein ligase TM129-like isoform X1 [Macrosteles quadrilineatus]|uniref:E3 ubiquitin-protein ligase TM129-like isoform X1 n=2 Tax=Macrosteles quadrilineatus TaxID=74068 RepID=UPI0023E2A077|nr:E3 ubiquitin-protein ligase TM129-like isoform X1 [Macrosteles quadrilineatus]
MYETGTLFTLFYIICSYCFVFKTNEFLTAGLTVESLFGRIIGSETENFVFYHIKRSTYTMFIHSFIPIGYNIGMFWIAYYPLIQKGLCLMNIIGTIGLILPITTGVIVYRWRKNNWEEHPISKRLALFSGNAGQMNWRTLASDINVEFRRVNKIIIKCGTLVDVVVTENWIIKVTPYNMYFAHQSNTTLSLDTADTHALAVNGSGSAQFLNIKVSFTQRGSHHFYIRLNALDYKDLKDKVLRPIQVAQDIVFHQTKAEQFVEVFKEQVYLNPRHHPTEELEMCIGCMVNLSNIKLVKHCIDEGIDPCGNCYCRPMWCISCMGRWFASRQDQDHPEVWLSSKCTCPMCRSVFCILDVSLIQETQADELN